MWYLLNWFIMARHGKGAASALSRVRAGMLGEAGLHLVLHLSSFDVAKIDFP